MSLYCSDDSGVHGVKGAIRYHWMELGAQTPYLGYPTSEEYEIQSGKRSDFQEGFITWDSTTGAVHDNPQ